MQRFQGRVALVTGGSSGIGNAIARAFGQEGATVVVADIRREPKLSDEPSVFDHLDELGADSMFVETDVSDPDDAKTAVEQTVAQYGGLDILVNNAGIYYRHTIHETPEDDWDDILSVNLDGVYHMSKAAVPHLKESTSGKIINLSSIAGIVGDVESAAYCASKGGITNLTRQMALDYADDEINVNAIAPGVIKTAQNAEWHENDPDIAEAVRNGTPWPRLGEPEDVAPGAVFLASDESEFVTGHILRIDGGWLAK